MIDTEQDTRRAHGIFKDHSEFEIVNPNTLRMYRDSSRGSTYFVEFIACAQGTLLVHGDGPDLLLRSYQRMTNLGYLLRWAGEASPGYIGSKVAAGERYSWDLETAVSDLKKAVAMELTDGDRDERAEMVGILGDLDEGPSEDEARDFDSFYAWLALDSGLPDWLTYDAPSYGQRPSFNLLMAQAACKRASEWMNEGNITQ